MIERKPVFDSAGKDWFFAGGLANLIHTTTREYVVEDELLVAEDDELANDDVEETERNLRRKLPRGLPILAEILGDVHLEVVDDPAPQSFARWLDCIEAKDAPIVEAAAVANIDYLLTLNSRDFTPVVAARSGLTILAPSQFVERIREIITAGL